MSLIKIGINGFGRIGRKILRLALERSESIAIVGINDLSSPEQMLHLLKYDSVHSCPHDSILKTARLEGEYLYIGDQRILLTAQKDPALLPWEKIGAYFVHECTGYFTQHQSASLHLSAGAKKVIISAPSHDADITLCMGVNEKLYSSDQHHILSNASCTTNCLAPVVKVLDEHFGVIHGTMLTIHSYTNDQQLLDFAHTDLRRARAAALSQIPTTTGAAKAVGLVIPHLKGKIDGLAVRVPTPNVSLVDFTANLQKATTSTAINQIFQEISEQQKMHQVLGYTNEPLVSIDFNGNKKSATVDGSLTCVLNGTFAKVIAWYDNESGFSSRMLDLTTFIAKKDKLIGC